MCRRLFTIPRYTTCKSVVGSHCPVDQITESFQLCSAAAFFSARRIPGASCTGSMFRHIDNGPELCLGGSEIKFEAEFVDIATECEGALCVMMSEKRELERREERRRGRRRTQRERTNAAVVVYTRPYSSEASEAESSGSDTDSNTDTMDTTHSRPPSEAATNEITTALERLDLRTPMQAAEVNLAMRMNLGNPFSLLQPPLRRAPMTSESEDLDSKQLVIFQDPGRASRSARSRISGSTRRHNRSESVDPESKSSSRNI